MTKLRSMKDIAMAGMRDGHGEIIHRKQRMRVSFSNLPTGQMLPGLRSHSPFSSHSFPGPFQEQGDVGIILVS